MAASAERRAGVVGIRFIDANDIDANDKEGAGSSSHAEWTMIVTHVTSTHTFGRAGINFRDLIDLKVLVSTFH